MCNSCQSSTLDIGVLGYIGIVQHKEHSPEVLSIPPGTPCVYDRIFMIFLCSKFDLYVAIETKDKPVFSHVALLLLLNTKQRNYLSLRHLKTLNLLLLVSLLPHKIPHHRAVSTEF